MIERDPASNTTRLDAPFHDFKVGDVIETRDLSGRPLYMYLVLSDGSYACLNSGCRFTYEFCRTCRGFLVPKGTKLVIT